MATPVFCYVKFFRKTHSFDRIHHILGSYLTTSSSQDIADKVDRLGRASESTSFKEIMSWRREQAKSSILVSYQSSLENLLKYCQSFGKVVYSYAFSSLARGQFAMIEFKTPSAVEKILEHTRKAQPSSTSSRYFKFTGKTTQAERTKGLPVLNSLPPLHQLLSELTQAADVNDQLTVLMQRQELQEEELRLRFFVCVLIEESFRDIFPACVLHPFGSMVNSYGKRDCDVDMFIERGVKDGIIPVKKGRQKKYQLVYDRDAAISERVATQLTLETLAKHLVSHVPHCSGVFRIINARCPLVKFRHLASGLQCDLTGDNRIAMKSSELLYVFGQLDYRVRPLVFFVRDWARIHGVTNIKPGYWMTNFPLTLLVIYFLQTRKPPIVPSIDNLRDLSAERIIIDDVDCTFTDNPSKVAASTNKQTVEELVYEFFEFISSFNFEKYGMSLRTASRFPSPRDEFRKDALHIENPLEPELNTSRNTNHKLVSILREASVSALHCMDSSTYLKSGGKVRWGISSLLVHQDQRSGLDIQSLLPSLLRSIEEKSLSNSKRRRKPKP